MACTTRSAVSAGSSRAKPLSNDATWMPEPQNPSPPCVAEIVISTREAPFRAEPRDVAHRAVAEFLVEHAVPGAEAAGPPDLGAAHWDAVALDERRAARRGVVAAGEIGASAAGERPGRAAEAIGAPLKPRLGDELDM